jgi:hypothetical protein
MSRAPSTTRMAGLILRIAFGSLLASLAAAPAHSGGTDANTQAELATLRKEIQRLAGDGRCNNVVQCRAIPLGKRACGGPDEYVIFSSMTGKTDLLEAKVFEYTFLQEESLRGKPESGPCEFIVEPQLRCFQQRCRADEGGQ